MAKKKEGDLVPASPHAAVVPAGMEDLFDKYARDVESVSIGAGGWNFISTRNGVFTLRQETLENPLNCIILGNAHDNAFYDRAFDPENFESPKCAAVGRDEATMGPPPEWPDKQSDLCRTCQQNAWGSSERGGRGKACGNRI